MPLHAIPSIEYTEFTDNLELFTPVPKMFVLHRLVTFTSKKILPLNQIDQTVRLYTPKKILYRKVVSATKLL